MAKTTAVLLTFIAASIAPAACGLLSGHSLARTTAHSVARRSLLWPGREFGSDPWGVVLGPPPQAALDTPPNYDPSTDSNPPSDPDPLSSSVVDSAASPAANPAAPPESEAPIPPASTPDPVDTIPAAPATPSSPPADADSSATDRVATQTTQSASAHTFLPKPAPKPTEHSTESAPPKDPSPSPQPPAQQPAPQPKPEPTPTPSPAPAPAPKPEPSHTSSSAPQPPPPSTGSGSTSSADIQAYLQGHNDERTQHGASPLTWSDSLAATAQGWANNCVFKHSGGTLGPFGENLAAGTGSFSIAAGIGAWNAEASQYNPSNPQASHWTQVVWKATEQVGCAVQTCNGIFPSGAAQFYVCEYSPAGNVIGEFAQNVQA